MSTQIAAGPVPMPRPDQMTVTKQSDGTYVAYWPDTTPAPHGYGYKTHRCKNWGAALDLFIQALQPDLPAPKVPR